MGAKVVNDQELIHIPTATVLGVMLTGAVAFVGFIIKMAARQVLTGFKEALDRHSDAIDRNTLAIDQLKERIMDHDARLKALER